MSVSLEFCLIPSSNNKNFHIKIYFLVFYFHVLYLYFKVIFIFLTEISCNKFNFKVERYGFNYEKLLSEVII